jgi:hypothetical protein
MLEREEEVLTKSESKSTEDEGESEREEEREELVEYEDCDERLSKDPERRREAKEERFDKRDFNTTRVG